jgi:Zn finger protein HypA/HybF involved in hydrogenase expression
MSEEIKKEMQDVELDLEKLDKVAGGSLVDELAGNTDAQSMEQSMGEYDLSRDTFLKCPMCRSTNLQVTKVYSENHGDFTCKDCGHFFTFKWEPTK